MGLNATFIGILAAARERNFSAELTLLGTWPLSETSGNTFADTVGANTATLSVPSWTVATHEWNRLGIAVGTDHALEVSNGGPAIPMAAGYKNAAVSFAFYVCPLSELRGEQHWNVSAEGYRREFLAHCDDGSTPGSFAIERRKFSATEWRLDGYVRNGSGTAVRFSGGLNGISGATLPVDVAKRIVLTQGTSGANLYLDGSLVGSLGSVTTGWGSLTTAITLGSSSNTGHANDRSPFWGRIDEIKVWQGNLDLTAVQALPAASSTRLWRYPSDFNAGTSKNVADFASVQLAIDAAHTDSVYVYQLDSNATYYSNAVTNGGMLRFKNQCKGMLGVRLRLPSGAGLPFQEARFWRILNVSNFDWGEMGTHGDPYASTGGYKFIGCYFDGNSNNQDWHPRNNEPGFTNTSFDLEHQWQLFLCNRDVAQSAKVDACVFFNSCSDGVMCAENSIITSTSNRFYGVFRGAHVINESPLQLNAIRYEALTRTNVSAILNGTGLQDVESFSQQTLGTSLTFRDVWAEGDFDDENEGSVGAGASSYARYYNCHTTGAAIYIATSGQGGATPAQDWQAHYSTFNYHRHGPDGGNFPSAWLKGFTQGANGYGCLFDHCTFVANGTPYLDDGIMRPTFNTDVFALFYQAGDSAEGPRLWTQRNCEWRVKALPGGIPRANIHAIDHQTVGTTKIVELDGVLIDAAFTDFPFDMGAATVRYRNVLHERVGHPNPTKPWSDAGAEVAF